MNILTAYRWPGNVRELGNMIERAVALSENGTFEEQDLPESILNFMPEPTTQITRLPDTGIELETVVENLEIGLIQQALKRTNDSRKKSAALLELTTRSFRYRLQKYKLEVGSKDNE